MLVRIVKNYPFPDLMRQTSGFRGIWDGIQFTTDSVENCDYIVVLNHAASNITINCPPDNVWALMQEPPNETYRFMHRGNPSFARIFTQDTALDSSRHIHSQPGLPWHVNRDFDFLINCPPPEKSLPLSWITGSGNAWKGHRVRMKFLARIRDQIPFDLFGRGFKVIDDKWDGIAPYRYSIAFENFSSPHYWSEKLADCFLAWTMPIYFGCTKITDYFPAESMIQIDPEAPDLIDRIKAAIASDAWIKNRDAIAHARELVLKQYQFFPLIAGEIHGQRARKGFHQHPHRITIPGQEKTPVSPATSVRMAVYDTPMHMLWRARRKIRHLRGLPV
jgi:hypothetical protein